MSKQNCVKWDKEAKDDDFICKKKMYIYFYLVQQLSLTCNGTFFLQCKYNLLVTKKDFYTTCMVC